MKNTKFIKASQVAICLTLFVAVAAGAVASQLLYSKSGISEFKLVQQSDGMRTTTKTMNDFELVRHFPQGNETLFLVSTSSSLTQYLDAEGIAGTIAWNVRKGPKLESLLWSKSEPVTELNVNYARPVIVTGQGGCCAEMTGYRLYNIEDGKLLMSFNDFIGMPKVTQPFSLEVPNSNLVTRYIGIISQDSTRDRDFVAPAPGKEAAILIKYANEALKQKIQVEMDVAPGYAVSIMEATLEPDPAAPDSSKIEIHDGQADLWNIDGSNSAAQISGVRLKVTLNAGYGDQTLRIPVKNDEFDLSQALISAGMTLNAVH